MRIPIPEMDERFECVEDAIEHILRICSVIVEKAKMVYPSASVAEIPGYALEFCRKVLVQVTTLVGVARERKDYNTTCSLIRMLADNVAILNLVYCCREDEERILRHLLYVLDGVTDRYALLESKKPKFDGKIQRDVFDALVAQVEGARENAKGCIEYCKNTIRKKPDYPQYQQAIETLIQNRNWKYRNINTPKNSYSWKEMYSMLEIKSGNEMFPYLSQYVHGLSISNIALNDEDDFEAPLSFAFCLIFKVFEFLRMVYEPRIGEYTWRDIYNMEPQLFGQ